MFWRFLIIALSAGLLSGSATAETLRKRIVCFGDSLTAGYGLTPDEAWPALLQQRLKSRESQIQWSVLNSGQSGETSTGGLRRISWMLREPVDVFILALGANDGLRGQPVDAMRKNLAAIFQRVREANPQARFILAGMRVPLNLGESYAESFAGAFPEVAAESGAKLIPFLLEGVATIPELNLPDGIHPNAEGQRILEQVVWETLGPVVAEVEAMAAVSAAEARL